mgnify:CR=1 FL=1
MRTKNYPTKMASCSRFCTYKSVKFINVHDKRLAVIHYVLMATLLTYVLAYQVFAKGGYQAHEPFVGNVVLKLKGVAETEEGRPLGKPRLSQPH